MTLRRFQCFNFQHWHCIKFNVSESIYWKIAQCFSIFFNFFGQKGRSNSNFRTNFTLLIKKRKPNLIFAYSGNFFCYLKINNIWKNCNIETLKSTLKHWKHWIKFNVEILKTLTSHWVSMFIFLTSKTLNRNQCQCRTDP